MQMGASWYMLLSSLAGAAGLRLPASGQPKTWSRRAACALPFALPLAAVAGKPLPASHARLLRHSGVDVRGC